MSTMSKWKQLATVPINMLKTIGFGALKGKSDINPQWRIKAMSEVYGECGIGWYHEAKERWSEKCENGEVMVFVEVSVYTKTQDKEWSAPINGIGGNKTVALANGKPKPSDEGWKMAYTDALGTALKSLGVASEVYEGNWDGSKYNAPTDATPDTLISSEQYDTLADAIEGKDEMLKLVQDGYGGLDKVVSRHFDSLLKKIKAAK